ncbi:hypothetical protein [Haloarcula nitratireducens]|uniref:Uncharacterized protein n=1 Tax=Haloarcula nitratireducens TaxID=2487749 RepID=A0AAW4PJ90_9EURY|nr:hypothetical protein [Halomicroarcula nitratireducens]MBX0297536.1 hypothetical protein [Halomicroarcula nitratireducens]
MAPETGSENIVNQLAGIDGVLRDDIHVQEEKVTTYIPKDTLEAAREVEGIMVEVLEEHEHEYLIMAEPTES